MRRRTVILLAIVAATAAAVAGDWAARRTFRQPDPAPAAEPRSDLVIGSDRLNFGEVWETDQFDWNVPVRNQGSTPIRATSHTSSCSCVSPIASTLLAPGETADLKFRIDLRLLCWAAEPNASARDVAIKVFAGSDAASAGTLVPVELRGRVKRALVLGSRMVDLGRTPAGTQPPTRTVPVRSLVDVRDLSVSRDDAVVNVELRPNGAGSWDLRLAAVPNPCAGTYMTTVRLYPVLASGEKPPPLSLPVEFEFLGDIQPDSLVVALGTHAVGSSAKGQITLRSLSGRPFTVDRWSLEPMGSMEVTGTSADGASRRFTVHQKVAASGDQTARVWFTGKDADGRAFERVVEVRHYGLGSVE